MPHADTALPKVVLDTNVVLDWLLFKEPTCLAMTHRIQAGQWVWLATATMRDELASVLPRKQFADLHPDCECILLEFDRWARVVEPKVESATVPRCRDPDDQKFIDLALSSQALWLFTRDRALLDLAKTARARGLGVVTPADWLRRLPNADSTGSLKLAAP